MAALAGALQGQPAGPSAGLTISQAVEDALRNYPSIRVTQEQMNAAAAGIRLAQTAYLPRVDGLAQINRGSARSYGSQRPAS
jgi:outer membrane protein TolC